MSLQKLTSEFDNILVLDTETTGIDCKSDEIIELAVLRAEKGLDSLISGEEMDEFLRLSPGKVLSSTITNLTGITPERLENKGIEKAEAAARFCRMIEAGERTLIVAYNAQFDLCFLYFFLQRLGMSQALRGVKMLDAMTIYKDRRPYPHKLANAVDAYRLQTQNTHRAIDDARATLELLQAMDDEKSDLAEYLNLFGFHPKYGVSGPRIASVHYLPQGYQNAAPLYLQAEGVVPF